MIPSSLYCQVCGAANATDRSVCFACNRPLHIAESDNTVLLQGRYRILTQVGKGGFGAVYRAEDTQKHGGIVAVKQINLRGLTSQETIEATDAFNREVSLLSKLSHPNLPHIYDDFTDPEHWYLVMDFIEGETLETYLEAKCANYTASLDEILTLGIQLCTVLDYLHTREPSIIFRDLKPANIMRTSTNKLYLIDFGIARSFKPGKLKDTIPFGSPGYAAPEQYGKAQTTPRADIYSLGALLHMLLTGDDPVDNPFHFAPLRVYGVAGLTDLEALILRMVQIDANNRPASIVEVKDELQRIADLQEGPRLWHPPVGQTPPAFPIISGGSGQLQISTSSTGQQQQLYVPSSQRKRSSRRKFLVGGFAIAGLTIIGVGGIANIVSALHAAPERIPYDSSIGQPQATAVTGNADLFLNQYAYMGHAPHPVRSVAWSADGNVASTGDDGTIQVWIKEDALSHSSKPQYKYDVGVPVQQVAWGQGPPSANILAFSQDHQMCFWDTSQGEHEFAIDSTAVLGIESIDNAINNAFAWSPLGKSIAYFVFGKLHIADIKTRVIRQFKLSHNPLSCTSLSWSSDGHSIAVGTSNGDTIICDATSEQTISTLTAIGSSYVTWSPDGKWLATVNADTVYVSSRIGSMFSSTLQILPFKVTALAWSPDSNYIAVGGLNGDAHIYIWSPFTNATPTPFGTASTDNGRLFLYGFETGGVDVSSLAWSPGSKYIAVAADNAYLIEINTLLLNS